MNLLEQFSVRAEELRVLNIRVFQEGARIAAADWDEDVRRNQYSASKSVASAAVGLAVKEGLLSLSERVADAFPEEMPEKSCENLEALTVRDLLTMCAGQDKGNLMGPQRPLIPDDNWVRYSLAQPFPYMPGGRFVYNNMGPYLAGILVQRRCGCDLVDYLMPRLFAPLGIRRPVWECDPQGFTFGAGGLFLTVDELAKFTLLHLQQGQWEGRRILTGDWVGEATRKQVENDRDEYGYGYLFWRGPQNSYRCDGKYGQFGIALPEKNAVIAVNAECRNQKALLDWVFETVACAL